MLCLVILAIRQAQAMPTAHNTIFFIVYSDRQKCFLWYPFRIRCFLGMACSSLIIWKRNASRFVSRAGCAPQSGIFPMCIHARLYSYMSMRGWEKKYMVSLLSQDISMSKNEEAFSLYFRKPSLTLLGRRWPA